MPVLALALLAQLAVAPRPVEPVLTFPDAGLDDTTAYRGYQTRFYRDAARNTLQVYLDQRSARVLHVLADADNASVGFTARTDRGDVAALTWAAAPAEVSQRGRTRRFRHQLATDSRALHLGWFLLGSMRVERDFQYVEQAKRGFGTGPYAIPEVDRMLAALNQVPAATQRRHLALLNARTVSEVRARMYPRPALRREGAMWVTRVQQVTLDARDTLTLELRVPARLASATVAGDSLSLRALGADALTLDVTVTTTAPTLTPLTREQIFTADFLSFLASTTARGNAAPAGDTAAIRARRMERQVRGVELLVSREKLMAGLPTYATYFGRDMLMTALMMRPIWRHETMEAVIATALRKLAPRGDVSHEEALGDQATRESAGDYATLVTAALAASGTTRDSLLSRADTVVRQLRTTRENYHMIDDEYQLPIVVARWITDPTVPAAAKKAFLLDRTDGNGTRAQRLLRELALVAELTAAYAADPVTSNLIAFSPGGPSGFQTASWRDSGAGYAGGRYAMDINVMWVPHALESVGQILDALRTLGIDTGAMTRGDSPLARYAREPARLQQAITTWRGASRHFLVTRNTAELRAAAMARLAAMPEAERTWWQSRTTTIGALSEGISFLALALDASGAPIPVLNTDVATQLFLGDGEGRTTPSTAAERATTLRDVQLFARPYPAGLFVDRIGPVVSNDAFASPAVWDAFVKDPYHGPRVVWGREVNLFLLGVSERIMRATGSAPADPTYVATLRDAMTKVRTAVEASGFHTELWSYNFEQGRLQAMRYGSGGDIQLWSTTDLAVQYMLDRLPR
jgi:hypothetical protein